MTKLTPDSDDLGNTDDGIIKKPLKRLSELRKYIERPRVVNVQQNMPRAPHPSMPRAGKVTLK